jgi:4-amino-4-deoxy-L-arabinose transferase-like glycosyltransferase
MVGPTANSQRWVMQKRTALLMWIALIALLVIRFIHPAADFPLHSRWIDDAGRYTDEGWYSSGAIDHVLHGAWTIPGDFNPVVDIPVWPVLLNLWFQVTGMSMASARLLDIIFSCLVVLLAGLLMRRYEPDLALPAALLVAASPIMFFFGRLALLETPMLVFVLLAMLTVAKIPAAGYQAYLRAALAGLFIAAAIFTKTTALFLLPAALSLIWFENRDKRSSFLRLTTVLVATLAVAYLLYWHFAITPHLGDHLVLMKENQVSLGIKSIAKTLRVLYRGVTWTDPILFPIALVASIAAFSVTPQLRRHPLAICCWLWCIGYAAFMVAHVAADPRYFVVLAPPAIFLALLFAKSLYGNHPRAFVLVSAAIACSLLWNAGYIAWRQSRPQYTFQFASSAIANTVKQYPEANPLLIGHGIGGLTLYSGLPVLNELGTYPLNKKLDVYQPGWILVWEDDAAFANLDPFPQRYIVVPRGTYPALDQFDRRHLLLYELIPRQNPDRPR